MKSKCSSRRVCRGEETEMIIGVGNGKFTSIDERAKIGVPRGFGSDIRVTESSQRKDIWMPEVSLHHGHFREYLGRKSEK